MITISIIVRVNRYPICLVIHEGVSACYIFNLKRTKRKLSFDPLRAVASCPASLTHRGRLCSSARRSGSSTARLVRQHLVPAQAGSGRRRRCVRGCCGAGGRRREQRQLRGGSGATGGTQRSHDTGAAGANTDADVERSRQYGRQTSEVSCTREYQPLPQTRLAKTLEGANRTSRSWRCQRVTDSYVKNTT